MSTLFACVDWNNHKFRQVYHKSFSSQTAKKLTLINFEKGEKFVNEDCPLDVVNSKIFKQLTNGLISISVSLVNQREIELTIGNHSIKLGKADITESDYIYEELYTQGKINEKNMKDYEQKQSMYLDELNSLKLQKEELEQSIKVNNEETRNQFANLINQLAITNQNVTKLRNNPAILEQDLPVTLQTSFPESSILTTDNQANFLNKCFGKLHQRWTRIHKGSTDGFSVTAIHQNVLTRGPFLILVKTNDQYIFGGFNSVGMKGTSANKFAHGSYLFSLVRNGLDNQFKKLETIPGKTSNYFDGNPCQFGDSTSKDLFIADSCSTNSNSESTLGNIFASGDGSANYLAGKKNFQVTELEYYIPNMMTYNQ